VWRHFWIVCKSGHYYGRLTSFMVGPNLRALQILIRAYINHFHFSFRHFFPLKKLDSRLPGTVKKLKINWHPRWLIFKTFCSRSADRNDREASNNLPDPINYIFPQILSWNVKKVWSYIKKFDFYFLQVCLRLYVLYEMMSDRHLLPDLSW
jgi:hypothetical protein